MKKRCEMEKQRAEQRNRRRGEQERLEERETQNGPSYREGSGVVFEERKRTVADVQDA